MRAYCKNVFLRKRIRDCGLDSCDCCCEEDGETFGSVEDEKFQFHGF